MDILGLSEIRCLGSGKQKITAPHIYYSGGSDPSHRYGVAVLFTNRVARSVIDYVPLSDRVKLIKLQTTHRILNII